MSIELKPCPFCGTNPEARWSQINPKARCRTEGCKGSQLPVTRLDDPEDIAAWNTRAALSQQPAQSVNEKHFGDFELLVVTTAYEQGFGHAFRTELSNPYAPDTNAYKAWDMGRSAGKRNGQPQQPATTEPVAWIRRHPNGALSNELLIHVRVEQVRRDSGAWVPLYTHPATSVRAVVDAAVRLVCAPAWAGISDEDIELEQALRNAGFGSAMLAAK